MFGLGITIFKKNKGVEIAPVVKQKTIKVVDEDYQLFLAQQREKEVNERKEIISKVKNDFYDKVIVGAAESFAKKWPAPFEVGEEVIVNYYGGYNEFSIGWYSSPQSMYSQFNIPEVNGTWKAPIKNIFVNVKFLWDKICDRADYPSAYTTDIELTEEIVERALWNKYHEMMNHKRWSMEWVVDFDWHELKIPYKSGREDCKGYLDLRWGGFNAHYFISASTAIAKKQMECWAVENRVNKEKAKLEIKKKELDEQLKKAKNKL